MIVIDTHTKLKAVIVGALTLLMVCNTSALYASNHSQTAISKVSEERKSAEKIITNVKVFYNPIAEQVAVTFKLTKAGNVAIKVMDALGNEILNLHNADLDEGMQSLSFETEGKLTSGFYFVRVSSVSETVIKRISVR